LCKSYIDVKKKLKKLEAACRPFQHSYIYHAPTTDRTYDTKDTYEELERVFNKFPKYHLKMVFGDFNAEVGREDIFKPTTRTRVYTKFVMIMELE
jgi:hypothetical protein